MAVEHCGHAGRNRAGVERAGDVGEGPAPVGGKQIEHPRHRRREATDARVASRMITATCRRLEQVTRVGIGAVELLHLSRSSGLTVCSSSLTDCCSSFDVSSSSLADCNSSLTESSSSLLARSSSVEVSYSSSRVCRRSRVSRSSCSAAAAAESAPRRPAPPSGRRGRCRHGDEDHQEERLGAIGMRQGIDRGHHRDAARRPTGRDWGGDAAPRPEGLMQGCPQLQPEATPRDRQRLLVGWPAAASR